MTCPANRHMREAMERREIEAIHEGVSARPLPAGQNGLIAELLRYAEATCRDAWRTATSSLTIPR